MPAPKRNLAVMPPRQETYSNASRGTQLVNASAFPYIHQANRKTPNILSFLCPGSQTKSWCGAQDICLGLYGSLYWNNPVWAFCLFLMYYSPTFFCFFFIIFYGDMLFMSNKACLKIRMPRTEHSQSCVVVLPSVPNFHFGKWSSTDKHLS